MIYFTSTLLNIIVYLITFAVMWHAFRKREKDIEWEYQAAFSRVCGTFVYTMQTVTQALQAQQAEDEPEPEPTTLNEWTATLCKATHCHYFDGFGCTRSDVVKDGEEACPCDIDMRRATE